MYAARNRHTLANHGLVREGRALAAEFLRVTACGRAPHPDLIGTVPKRVGVHAAENLGVSK